MTKDDDPCVCGHDRRMHLKEEGACFSPEGPTCLCQKLCRKFQIDLVEVRRRASVYLISAEQHDRIERAREYIDADWDGRGWKPSSLMTIGYCAIATSNHPEEAVPFLDGLLEDARDKFRRGVNPNPFSQKVAL